VVVRSGSARARRTQLVLVMSTDPVAAALVGALVETLGYDVRFSRAGEHPTQTLGRERPDVAFLDGGDQLMIAEEVLGHAVMRNIRVVVFGDRAALERIRTLAHKHRLPMLIVPASLDEIGEVLEAAMEGPR
jgi:CheY-like chemotaxis protein